jgi:hypothetical protein
MEDSLRRGVRELNELLRKASSDEERTRLTAARDREAAHLAQVEARGAERRRKADEVRERSRRFNRKCKGCGTNHSVLMTYEGSAANVHKVIAADSRWPVEKPAYDNGELVVTCGKCGKRIRLQGVAGRYSADTKCDARCWNAKGNNCECQCAGRNHGGGPPVDEVEEP